MALMGLLSGSSIKALYQGLLSGFVAWSEDNDIGPRLWHSPLA